MVSTIYTLLAYEGMTAEVKEVETKKAYESIDCTPLEDIIAGYYYYTIDTKKELSGILTQRYRWMLWRN